MVDAIGSNAEMALVRDAGHAAHSEAPEAFLAIVRAFLAGAGRARPVP
jgi:pimeloyl-ACP methyl ester carboxylesterase